MVQPHIFLEGELTIVAHDIHLNPEGHEYLGKGIDKSLEQASLLSAGVYTVWLVEYGQTVSTEEVLASPPHPEAICGNSRELFQLVRKLRAQLEGSCIIALAETDTPYANVYQGRVSYGFASGKPYWAKTCQFLFLGASR